MEDILIGTTDRSILVFVPDAASTDGSGKTGLAHTDLTVSYTRVETDNDVVVTDVTSSLNALANLTDAHNDWGWKEVSSTLAPGLYRLDIADAVFAAGAWQAVVYIMVTTSAASAIPKGYRLVAINALDGVRAGLTALPNAAAEAAGGLFTRGTGAGQIAQTINGTIHADVQGILGTAVGPEDSAGRLAAAFTTFLNVASPVFTAASVNQTGDAYGVVNSGTHGNSALKTLIDAIKAITDALGATAAGRLAVSAVQMLPGTVDDTGFTPTTGEFEADDITEATPDHFNGRVILFTSGALQYQVCVITDYSLVGGRGHFTVASYGGGVLTEAPANDSTFLIV